MTNDLNLRQRVIDELAWDAGVEAAHVGVAARDGVITLSGHVDSYAQKLAAEQAARRVKGVKAIAEEIEVRLPSDRKTADDEIAGRAVRILSWDVTVPKDKIAIKVQHGIVNLSGEVDWEFQRAAAEADIHRLTGVKFVVNKVTVRPQQKAADLHNRIRAALERTIETDISGIHVDVKDHTVVLSGKVHAWPDREAAERAIWSAPGVTAVENRIMIGPA